MAIKAKRDSGVANPPQKGLFGSRLSKGQATGITRGTAKIGARTDTVNKQKYKIKQYEGY